MTDDSERQAKLEQMEHLKQLGEKAYDNMYEAHSFRDANDCYREAKDCYYDAIGLANQMGLKDEATALSERLWHIKEVFRHQFVQ